MSPNSLWKHGFYRCVAGNRAVYRASAPLCFLLGAASTCHGHVPRQKVPIGAPVLWKDFVTLSRLFCIVSVNRAHWPWAICMRMAEDCWNASTLFLWFSSCVVFGSALQSAIFPWKFSLSSLPYLGSIVHLAGTSYSMENNHTFLYFAYGSNLLKERLQLKNPSAIIHCVARLKVTPSRRR